MAGITMRPSKKRRILNTPAAKARRKAYALEQKQPRTKTKRQKADKKYYQKNKKKILQKQALTRRARKV